jgi:hypothetical protein
MHVSFFSSNDDDAARVANEQTATDHSLFLNEDDAARVANEQMKTDHSLSLNDDDAAHVLQLNRR